MGSFHPTAYTCLQHVHHSLSHSCTLSRSLFHAHSFESCVSTMQTQNAGGQIATSSIQQKSAFLLSTWHAIHIKHRRGLL